MSGRAAAFLLLLTAAIGRGEVPVRLEPQSGHTTSITATGFSPDGKLGLTASSGLVTLWELETGRQIYQVAGDWPFPISIAFPSADRLLVGALHPRNSGALYELSQGRTLAGGPQPIDSCADGAFLLVADGENRGAILERGRKIVRLDFAPDGGDIQGKRLYCTGDGRTALLAAPGAGNRAVAQLWDLERGRMLRQFVSDPRGVTAVALSPDGTTAATVDRSFDKVHIWDAGSGRELTPISDLPEPTPAEIAGGVPRVNTVAFSPDGRLLAAATVRGGIRIVEAQTGRSIARWRMNDGIAITSVAFSPDSRRVLAGNVLGAVHLYDVAAAKFISPPLLTVPNGPGRMTVVKDPDPAREPEPVLSLTSELYRTSECRLSPDGRYLFFVPEGYGPFAAWTAPLRYLDLRTGRYDEWTSAAGVTAISFTPNGRVMLLGHADSTVTLWDLDHRASIGTFPGPTTNSRVPATSSSPLAGMLNSAARTMVGKLTRVTAVASDGAVLVADYSDGSRRVVTLATHEVQTRQVGGNGAITDEIQVGAGGRMIVGYNAPAAAAVDAIHGMLDVARISSPLGMIHVFGPGGEIFKRPTKLPTRGLSAFTPDGKAVAISDGSAITVYDAASGAVKYTLPESAAMRRIAISHDGRRLAAATMGGDLALWDLPTAKLTWKAARVGDGLVNAIGFGWGDSWIFASQAGGISRFLRAADGGLMASLAIAADLNCVAVTPDGRFDASNLRSLPVHWVASDAPFQALPVELFLRDYYEPRLLARVLQGRADFPAIRSPGDVNRLLPKIARLEAVPEPGRPGEIDVRVEIAETHDPASGRGSGARNFRLMRNDRLVAYAPANNGPIELHDGKAALEFHHIRLSQETGQVDLSAYVFNEDGVRSSTYRVSVPVPRLLPAGVSKTPLAAPKAWLLQVGVGVSAVPALNLPYAGNDANRLRDVLSSVLRELKQYEKVNTGTLVSDSQHPQYAAKESIRRMIAATRPLVGPNDLFVLAFSSHGYADRSGRFYLIPSDAGKSLSGPLDESNFARLLAESISSDELSDWLRDVDAGHMVLILDTCQAAAAVEGSRFQPGPMGNAGLGQLAYDKGMTVLAASEADGVALESSRIAQGLLTYVLTSEALEQNRADWRPRDGKITLHEWLRYSISRVPDLWREAASGTLEGASATKVISPRGTAVPYVPEISHQPALFDFSQEFQDPVIKTVAK